jgi:3-oxocholest-4-en-26-oyl-CoA dehydrogenase beta subunit
MDFRLSEDQVTVRDLARSAFGRRRDPERLAGIEAEEDRFDRRLWQELADSGVLGLVVPEAHGGAGLGFSELALALVEQGRTVGRVPLLETAVLGALPLVRYGTEKQQAEWLPRVADGSAVLTAALEAPVVGTAVVEAAGDEDSWALTGAVRDVSHGHLAAAVVVPARTGDGAVHLFLVATDQPGVSRHAFQRTDRGVAADLELDGAAAQRLSDGPAEDRLDWLLRRAWTALAAVQLGVSQEAVKQAASYVSEREQFGVPLGTFQAVAHQLADCHIDTEAMEVTFFDALWRLETGRPAAASVHVAKFWAADAGDRVARTVQHVHGGLGADITYPVHRYMLWSSQQANTLGSASWHLGRIGALAAVGQPEEAA